MASSTTPSNQSVSPSSSWRINYPTTHLNIPYSSLTPLNTVDIYFPPSSLTVESATRRYWIVFIHGGAYRDPTITSTSIIPSLTNLPPSTLPIQAIASLNYRLSPYPNHPTQPSTPDDPSRNAIHPAHIEDILAGIAFLQEEYGFEHYVLVGHSVGATLAFQTCMRAFAPPAIKIPDAIVGVAGIYDFPLLVANHAEVPAYRDFVTGAFGPDESVWRAVSPAKEDWGEGGLPRVVVLGWSSEDELVEEGQGEGMGKVLGPRAISMKMKGGHDELWMGGGVAVVIEEALARLVEDD